MRSTLRLFNQYHVTLFTRQNCSLCVEAEHVLSKLKQKRDFEVSKIDVMSSGQDKWKSIYEFDTPVIHVDKVAGGNERTAETSTSSPKLMHRFSVEQVEKLMK